MNINEQFDNCLLMQMFDFTCFENRPALRQVCTKWNELLEQEFVVTDDIYHHLTDDDLPCLKVKCLYNETDFEYFFHHVYLYTHKIHIYRACHPTYFKDENWLIKIAHSFPNLTCLTLKCHSDLALDQFKSFLDLIGNQLQQLTIKSVVSGDYDHFLDLIVQHPNLINLHKLGLALYLKGDLIKIHKRFPTIMLDIVYGGEVDHLQHVTNMHSLVLYKVICENQLKCMSDFAFKDHLHSLCLGSTQFGVMVRYLSPLKNFTALRRLSGQFTRLQVLFLCKNLPELEYFGYKINHDAFHSTENCYRVHECYHKLNFCLLFKLDTLKIVNYENCPNAIKINNIKTIESVHHFIFHSKLFKANLNLLQFFLNLPDAMPNLEILQLKMNVYKTHLLIYCLERLAKLQKLYLVTTPEQTDFCPTTLAEFCRKKSIDLNINLVYP